MGLFSFIGSCISGACSFVGKCISTVGKAVATGAQLIAKGIGALAVKIKENVIKVAMAIANVAKSIAIAFGDVKEEDNIEEMGAKAMQEGTRSRDEFDSTKQYIEYLRNEVQLDQEKFDKRGDSDRLAYFSVGTELCRKNAEEKTGMKIPAEILLMAKEIDMKNTELTTCIQQFKDRGMTDMGDMVRYLKGEGGNLDRSTIKDTMIDGLQKSNSNMKVEEAKEQLRQWQNKLDANRDE